eukprot:COSAG01_NODE_14309_length_1470_cov_19.181619_2_plen_75_part_00
MSQLARDDLLLPVAVFFALWRPTEQRLDVCALSSFVRRAGITPEKLGGVMSGMIKAGLVTMTLDGTIAGTGDSS